MSLPRHLGSGRVTSDINRHSCVSDRQLSCRVWEGAQEKEIKWLFINPLWDGDHCCTSEIAGRIQSKLYSWLLSFVQHLNATPQSPSQLALSARTKCMGGSERTEEFPKVVMVRWNSPANHLVLSSPIEPMLENWPITGHASSPGMGSVWSYNSWLNNRGEGGWRKEQERNTVRDGSIAMTPKGIIIQKAWTSTDTATYTTTGEITIMQNWQVCQVYRHCRCMQKQ